jgi:hypothetical protein
MLNLTITLSASDFTLSQPITGTVSLVNPGSDPQTANTRLAINRASAPAPFRDVVLTLTGPDGATLPFAARVNIGAPKEKDFSVLAPGATVERHFDLARLFQLTAPGPYALTATYHNAHAPGWQGEVQADTVHFRLHAAS